MLDGIRDSILIVAEEPGAFAVGGGVTDGQFANGIKCDLYNEYQLPIDVYREVDAARGYIVNLTPETLTVTYGTTGGDRIGPIYDYIRPMEAKEIGAATKRMRWHIARPQRETPSNGS